MNTMDTTYDIWGDMWGQYIIIDMDEEEKEQKKCEKKNKCTKYNQKLRNISKLDCIDEESSYDERNNVISNDKNETLMDIVYSICTITWVMFKSHMN